MGRPPGILVALLLFTGWAGHTAQAQGAVEFTTASEATQRVADAYFAAYIARDWDRLERLAAASTSFQDPTATLVFGGIHRTGRDSVVANFRRGYAGITHMAFHRDRAFYSGHHAVYEGTLDWTLRLDDGREIVTGAMPFVVTLRVRDGLVDEHRDMADYHPWFDALRKAAPAR